MQGLNRVILAGNLGAAPELRYTHGGQPVLNMRLATTETWTDKEGEVHEKTEWHSVVLWGPRAEGLAKHLRKGTGIIVEGKIQTREYEKEGVKRYRTEINATNVQFADGPRSKDDDDDRAPAPAARSNGNGAAAPPPPGDDYGAPASDDIPF